MKFIYESSFDDKKETDVVRFDCVSDMLDYFNMNWTEQENHCYVTLLFGTENAPPDEVANILDYICSEGRFAEGQATEVIQFSVTTNESNYQEWLDAIEAIPNRVITEYTKKDYKGKPYTCFLCTFVNPYWVE